MKEYVLKETHFNGSTFTQSFSNLKKARSEAWAWINRQKSQIREQNYPSRDYGQLRVEILKWTSDGSMSQSESVAIYN